MSFAGRVKLINSMMFGITSFWCRLFVIPSNVKQNIQAICRNFLWSAPSEYKRSPLVSWEECPKNRGGLGLKNISGIKLLS
ncbi:hypothetical protein DM860_014512 [Cuscuta australis]|uniref:Reverse transcriptase zinc-binding domain-containing protein n=1 Tax=Cuscuta australis TaxID=267555 RepID=A0A328DZB7_9ASTE|nr:hypothetical protein DM860_014512 [Cuscuta australis]